MNTADLHTFAAAIFTAPSRTAPALADKVDRIGQLKAEIAERETKINQIRAELEDAGLSEIDGHAYRVTFSTSARTVTDWKTIAERFKPSPQLIRRHTTTGDPVTRMNVTARKTH